MSSESDQTWVALAWILIIVLGISIYNNAQHEQQAAEPVTTYPEIVQPLFNEPIQPLPKHGTTVEYSEEEAIAPFKIITKPQELFYFIKVVEWDSKRPVLTIFIHSGQDVDLLMPIGSYEIRFASGKTWHGEEHLFGSRTNYEKADERFNFTISGQQVFGYTLQLIDQQDGNLKKVKMKADEF
ncbi:hypothetical protein [Candidatus Contubernalis alkaliaceticus]|uniref:hypothetical protein n=1 Tax=Candidatus Contubernalis alkaliaceticus TaxID=338645 RepID=UPI001F4BEA4A|nr:hypothetical protein [Candidatus Contubernalis alkalaceticus]UNC91222.1 hypothetical protein HUE98_03425 [Candidatus Contubernalis alkalaceticus]